MRPVSGATKRSEIEAWAAATGDTLYLADGLDDALVGIVAQNDGTAAILYDAATAIQIVRAAHPELDTEDKAFEWFTQHVMGALGPGYPTFIVYRSRLMEAVPLH
jgi:hypothetical protein